MATTTNRKGQLALPLSQRWQAVCHPGSEVNERLFNTYRRGPKGHHRVLNCAIPLARALELTRFELPRGVSVADCLTASVTGNFPAGLNGFNYLPRIRAVPQLPQLRKLPAAFASLARLPWFQRATPSAWLGLNARHLRYNHELWYDLRPKILQGVCTTLILGLPQVGFSLTPRIQLEKAFLFLGALARGLGPAQLFPGRFIYPEANLGHLADAPAPVFADILPTVGGFAYPVVDGEPTPWRVLAHFGRTDRYYGFPFRQVKDAMKDFRLQNHEQGAMLLPSGERVAARCSESRVCATLDPELNRELRLTREEFAAETCLLRGTITHDGLPFQLPVQMQPLVYAVVLTHWLMELDRPGEPESYTVSTKHAAIRGFDYYQRVDPRFSNFNRLVHEVSRDPSFCTYPLANHLTDSWLSGNVQVSNQLSRSERELGPDLVRAYYRQQLDWQMGILNLMNHVPFRTRQGGASRVARTGSEVEQDLDLDGLAFHQMHRLLRFDSHLFPRATRPVSCWPNLHLGFAELDRNLLTESLPKI